ncbi:YhjD/YihY/BrkB family envelope integrity protein [Marispirochaeta aestuarii]|nr:YhjD/YihY/BrkB family envelope integrity protein [Marispirochaeta aestuarii]
MNKPGVIKQVLQMYTASNGPMLAKGLTYNLLLGLLPFLFLVFWSAAVLVDVVPGLLELLELELIDVLPAQIGQIVRNQISYLGRSKGALGILTVGIFSVTVFLLFESLGRIIRILHGRPRYRWFSRHLISLGMVFGTLLFIYISAVLSLGVKTVHHLLDFAGEFPPFGTTLLVIILPALFFALSQIIYAGRRLNLLSLIPVSLISSGLWYATALGSNTLIRYAGRRFIIYGAMAGAVSYAVFLRILAEIVVFATLIVRFTSFGKGDDRESAGDMSGWVPHWEETDSSVSEEPETRTVQDGGINSESAE